MFTKLIVPADAPSFNVYGPTDMEAARAALSGVTTVTRSDYLDKLQSALADGKQQASLAFIGVNPNGEARGFDADHPYVTSEKGIERAWRYIAVRA